MRFVDLMATRKFKQKYASVDFIFTLNLLLVFPEELIHKSFSAYGCIQEIRVFKEKGYAFIR